jgi:hypothetical protein
MAEPVLEVIAINVMLNCLPAKKKPFPLFGERPLTVVAALLYQPHYNPVKNVDN